MRGNTISAVALGALLVVGGACGSSGDDDDDGNTPAGGSGAPMGGSGAPMGGSGMPQAGGGSGSGGNSTGGGAGGANAGAGGMSGGMSGGGTSGGAGTTPPAMTDCSSRGGDPAGSCKDSASGTFAIKTVVDVWWAQETALPIVDPGRGQITVYLMGKLSDVCADGKGMGDIKGCGVELPPFVSYAACDAFQIEFPNELWDKPTMPHFQTTGNTSGFEPGQTLAIDIATGLVGISLMDKDGAWPTPDQTGTFMCPEGMGEKCFPDADGDGKPGITLKMGKIGMNFRPNGCGLGSGDPVVFRGAPFDALTGVDDNSVRAETLYVGLRTRLGGAGLIGSDCKSGVGDAMAKNLDSRVWDCVDTMDQPCSIMGAKFVDENAPEYHILDKGQKPPADVMKSACECSGGCEGEACPLDQTASPGARSAIVRLGGLEEDFDCGAVRAAAYPAL